MTALIEATTGPPPAGGRAARHANAHVLVINTHGLVVILSAYLDRDTHRPPRITGTPGHPGAVTLGPVDWADPHAYRAAERLAIFHGWRPVGAWTTAGRYPARPVRRARPGER